VMRNALAAGALLVAAIVLGAVLGQRWLNEPMNVPPSGYALDLPTGTSLQSLAGNLAEKGILAHPLLLTVYGRLTGEAGAMKAGEYDIAPATSARELLRQLVEGLSLIHI